MCSLAHCKQQVCAHEVEWVMSQSGRLKTSVMQDAINAGKLIPCGGLLKHDAAELRLARAAASLSSIHLFVPPVCLD